MSERNQAVSDLFLGMYHNMLRDIDNAPKTFRNLKEGDTIYYIKYDYRGNYNVKSNLTVKEYKVSDFSEYITKDGTIEPTSFMIRVMRPVTSITIFSTNECDELYKPKTTVKSDSLMFVYEKDMDNDIAFSDWENHAFAQLVSLDKQKAIDRMREYVQTKFDKYSKNTDKYIADFIRDTNQIKEEYREILSQLDHESNT